MGLPLKSKDWYKSKTLHGAMIVILVGVLRVAEVSVEDYEKLVDYGMSIVQIASAAWAIVGRITANTVLR